VDIRILTRELTPFEHLVTEHLCEGMSNGAVGRETAHTEKVIENTVSRVARAFGIKSDGDTNVRVLLALAYRSQYGLGLPCQHLEVGADGNSFCNRHTD
jgi:DNA-binding NarL/FixJ family response regulator